MDLRWRSTVRPASLYERPDLRRATLITYLTCGTIAVLMLPFGDRVHWSLVAEALSVQLIVGTLVLAAPRLGLHRWSYAGSLAILAYLVSVALLRDGGGPTAGFGPLVLLPVMWASLRGNRGELAVAVVGVALVYIAPALLIGAPRYPPGSWRGGVLFAVISATLGITVIQLVRRVRALLGDLTEAAGTDELTGLPNRRTWQELLAREFSLATRSGRQIAVALLDIDHFKDYNDTHGHLAGDRVLLATTSEWQAVLRDGDVLARWGGDEFCLLLPGCNAQQAMRVLDRLRRAGTELEFSAGIAQWQPGGSPQDLLSAADQSLYEAKHGQRNRSAIAAAALGVSGER